jgi:hypothetical protein
MRRLATLRLTGLSNHFIARIALTMAIALSSAARSQVAADPF